MLLIIEYIKCHISRNISFYMSASFNLLIVCVFKFNLPALFIQWQSILTDAQNENLNYKSTAPDVLNKWLEKNPSGRILIIGPKTKNDKGVCWLFVRAILHQIKA